MKDLHDLYLKCDVLWLANVLEKLINSSLDNYGLWARYYLKAPGFNWDAMMNMTKVELVLVSDADIYLLFEKSVTQNKNQNILYTFVRIFFIVMICPNVFRRFKWIDPKNFNSNKYSRKSLKGCVSEVDLHYIKELRELHNDFRRR